MNSSQRKEKLKARSSMGKEEESFLFCAYFLLSGVIQHTSVLLKNTTQFY